MTDSGMVSAAELGGRSGPAPVSGSRSPESVALEASSMDLAESLSADYRVVRGFTERLTDGLAPEDMVVQSMADVSPTKWHLAHTSWFFEQFLLIPHLQGYTPLDPVYLYLFNSYYHQAGERHCRDQRGYISRPTVSEVEAYRRHVDEGMVELIDRIGSGGEVAEGLVDLITLGLHHEQQHQELLLTDIKHVFSVNPLRPVYRRGDPGSLADQGRGMGTPVTATAGWLEFEGGLHEIGHPGGSFAYDNEGPRHRRYLEPFALADRLVTNGEYLEFMEDGGYRRPELWLSLGWAAVQSGGWSEPFYWEWDEGGWQIFTLSGMRDLDPLEPVSHLNYFEADAYARWAGARLPTEAEWEVAASALPIGGNLVETWALHPRPLGPSSPSPAVDLGEAGGALVDDGLLGGFSTLGAVEPAALRALGAVPRRAESDLPSSPYQLYGDLWEWTSSPYTAYPGFRPAEGAVGEYNGKFMCNQFVLRGGSCATSASHIRPTYRNFFPPDASWQFTGVRLAADRG